mmetsp:Transcript_16774/g.50382  ORF Transcript_16774/g.50382 Transcript_16774/m.50382 type:complete len:1017 (-) Transcript_16774:94-3144(-)
MRPASAGPGRRLFFWRRNVQRGGPANEGTGSVSSASEEGSSDSPYHGEGSSNDDDHNDVSSTKSHSSKSHAHMAMMRQDTFMTQVIGRLNRLPEASRARMTSRHRSDSMQSERPARDQTSSDLTTHTEVSGRRPRCCAAVPMYMVVVLSTTVCLVLVCLGMFLPQVMIREKYKDYTMAVIKSLQTREHQRLASTAQITWRQSFAMLLREMVCDLDASVVQPPRTNVESLWASLMAFRELDPTFSGQASQDLIQHRALMQLLVGARRRAQDIRPREGLTKAVEHCQEAIGRPSSLFVTYGTGAQAGGKVNCSGFYAFRGGAAAEQKAMVETYQVDPVSLQRSGPSVVEAKQTTQRPYYRLQEEIVREATVSGVTLSSVPARDVWSGVYIVKADGDPEAVEAVMALTRPIAYCGNYSCFDGVLTATISLARVSLACMETWVRLADILKTPQFNYNLLLATSTVIIINHDSQRYPEQDGLLMGTSEGFTEASVLRQSKQGLDMAVDSEHNVTRFAARAILWYFGSWTAGPLVDTEVDPGPDFLSIRLNSTGGFEVCDSPFASPAMTWDDIMHKGGCLHIGMDSIRFRNHTRWLLVMVIPVGAFTHAARQKSNEFFQEVEVQEDTLNLLAHKLGTFSIFWFVVIGLLSFCASTAFINRVMLPLVQLSELMRKLSRLQFANIRERLDALVGERRSRIVEVATLQHEFCNLLRGMEAFTRFVPETVVRNIVSGEKRAARLHVERRRVTIMFSDVKDFTSISEQLSPTDLLTVLYAYLTAMTNIVERQQGVVAEVLGDGILAFWNTPDEVPDHAARACHAALEMLEEIPYLNGNFKFLRLPLAHALSIRVGLHTGEVFSGNLGSKTKMKFGCLGDPVNLASRLEGLCKVYGVDVLCSAETMTSAASSCDSFHWRRMDKVQVKGKTNATEIYEVMGLTELSPPSAERLEQARLYEGALEAFQQARFPEAKRLAEQLTLRNPGDVAGQRLLERASGYVAPVGLPVTGIILEDLANWTGIEVMAEK